MVSKVKTHQKICVFFEKKSYTSSLRQNLKFRKSFENFGAHHGIVLISDGNIHPWIRRTEKPNPINRSIKYQGLKIGLGTDCSGGYSPSLINGMRFSIATSNTVALTKKPENRGHLLDYQGAMVEYQGGVGE